MKKTNVVVVGYGNIGSFAVQAVLAAPDMELVGIVNPNTKKSSVCGIKVVKALEELGDAKVDVALLCVPTRAVPTVAKEYLEKGIHTVDPYDVHGDVWNQVELLDTYAKRGCACAIVSAGWDPGADSIVRVLMEACAPRGITHTNFGPGMSMGHSVAAKAIPGVENALSMTIPLGEGIHRRMVYVQLKNNASIEEITAAIKADPYFAHDETHVVQVENVNDYIDRGHAGLITRKGVSGMTDSRSPHHD